MLKKEFFTQRFVVDLQAHAFLSIDCFFLSLFIDICVLSEKNHLVMKMNTFLADVILMQKFCLNVKINVYFTKLLFIHISLYE